MHWLLNVVTTKAGDPQAVLIRACLLLESERPRSRRPVGKGLDVVSGPARLTKFLEIGRKLNGEDLVESRSLWIEDRGVRASRIKRTPRIGVDYAKEWKDKPLRFMLIG